MEEKEVSHLELYRAIVENHAEIRADFAILRSKMEENTARADLAVQKVIAVEHQLTAGKGTAKLLVWLIGAGSVCVGLWVALRSLLGTNGG